MILRQIITIGFLLLTCKSQADTCLTGSTVDLLKSYPSVVRAKVSSVVRDAHEQMVLVVKVTQVKGNSLKKNELLSVLGSYNSFSRSYDVGKEYTFPVKVGVDGKETLIGQPNECSALPSI